MYTIIVTDLYADDRASETTSYQIEKERITVGRSRSNEVIIRQTNVSSKHASISKTDKGFILEDLNSTNGTTVNGNNVEKPVRVFSDDQIEIGGTIIRVTGHPDLERGGANPSLSGFERRSKDDAQEPPNLDDLIATPAAGDYPFSNDSRLNPEPDFSLSSIAPLPSDAPSSGESMRSHLPYENSKIFKSGSYRDENNNLNNRLNPFPADDDLGSDDSQDGMGAPDESLLAKIEKLESRVVEDKKDSAGFSSAHPFRGSQSAFDPFATPLRRTPPGQEVPNVDEGRVQSEATRKAPFPETDIPKTEDRREKRAPYTIYIEARELGKQRGQIIEKSFKKQSILIGRDLDCDVCLQGEYVSRRHTIVEVSEGMLCVRDLGSHNGTYIDGRKVDAPQYKDNSTNISIGHFRVTCHLIKTPTEEGISPARALDTSIQRARTSGSSDVDHDKTMDWPKESGRPHIERTSSNIHDVVALQFHLAKKALGEALDEVQSGAALSADIRDICETMAQAIRLLYKTQVHGMEAANLQEVIDTILEKISLALEKMHRSKDLLVAPKALFSAHALVYHLSTEGMKYLSVDSASSGLSLLAEYGVWGLKKKMSSASREEILLEQPDIDGSMIASIKLHASLQYLSFARTLSRSVADLFFIDYMESLRLINVVDEACTNVIEHAYESGEQDCFHLSFYTLEDNKLAVVVDDQGLPMDTQRAERGETDRLGLKLMRAFCEEVHFVNRGRAGKRVVMILPLPSRQSATFFPLNDAKQAEERIGDTSQYEIRLLQPEMAEEISRCVFRAYRFDYFDDLYYRPQALFERLSSGEMLSAAAITPKGTVLGHLSVTFDGTAAETGLLGHSVVAPAMNSASITGKLTTFLVERCRGDGLKGINIHMTASHPYEQIVYASMGAKSTGVMLGYLPPSKRSTDRRDGFKTRRTRQSVVTAYLRLNESARRTVYLPSKYAEILSRIYNTSAMDRDLAVESVEKTVLPAISDVTLRRDRAWGVTHIVVEKIGDDIIESIHSRLMDAYESDPAAIYLDLPLSQPAILEVCPRLERFKFTFSCLIPETEHGDILRLQIVAFDIDLHDIHIENDFAKSIFKCIVDERAGASGL